MTDMATGMEGTEMVISLGHYLTVSAILLVIGIFGIFLNRKNVIVILVSVGADYNILLMSRVREESGRATRAGVARAVGATGGVITSAGLIFAGTFIAMATSPGRPSASI